MRYFKPGTICIQCLSPSCEHLAPPPDVLAWQELKLIRLLMAANQNKEIAYQMNIAEGTVKVMVTRIYAKLGFKMCGQPRIRLAQWGEANKHLLTLAPPPRKAA
jgi:DNA-binding NarL/FixJ family response regulator